jgi:uncharacterized membrane protein YfcA
MPPELLTLAGITLVAATINGALGYGFSSITVPLALLFFTNRVLNPALVLLEVALNANVLYVNRAKVKTVWPRVFPMIIGLLPGVIVGTWFLTYVNPGWMKLWTYIIVLPLILIQAGGFRRRIKAEGKANLAFGGGVGVLYSVTTISGPPLALMLNNQGFVKQEFRAGLALVRLAESSFTAVAYYFAGIYSVQSLRLIPYIAPSILIGVPIGAWLIARMPPETFRRVCMSFDAWVVGFGTSSVLRDLHVIPGRSAYLVLAAVIVVDAVLLYRFFERQRALGPAGQRATGLA